MSAARDASSELTTICAILRAAHHMLESHPNYGSTETEDGEMLCDVGSILEDADKRLQTIYYKVDELEAAADAPAKARKQRRAAS